MINRILAPVIYTLCLAQGGVMLYAGSKFIHTNLGWYTLLLVLGIISLALGVAGFTILISKLRGEV